MVIITDIFGNNNINNNTEFIIISGNDLNTYLTLKDSLNINDNTLTDETSQIYTVNKDNINDLFNKNNLNLKNFILSSDLLRLNNTININKILFINKNIGKIPEDFISIELYNNIIFWNLILSIFRFSKSFKDSKFILISIKYFQENKNNFLTRIIVAFFV